MCVCQSLRAESDRTHPDWMRRTRSVFIPQNKPLANTQEGLKRVWEFMWRIRWNDMRAVRQFERGRPNDLIIRPLLIKDLIKFEHYLEHMELVDEARYVCVCVCVWCTISRSVYSTSLLTPLPPPSLPPPRKPLTTIYYEHPVQQIGINARSFLGPPIERRVANSSRPSECFGFYCCSTGFACRILVGKLKRLTMKNTHTHTHNSSLGFLCDFDEDQERLHYDVINHS